MEGTLYPCIPGHRIIGDIEMIASDDIEAGFDRMKRGDVKYRFVVDIATLAN